MYAPLFDELLVIKYGLEQFFHHVASGRCHARITMGTLPRDVSIMVPRQQPSPVLQACHLPLETRVQVRSNTALAHRGARSPQALFASWLQRQFFASIKEADEALHTERTWQKIQQLFGDDTAWFTAFERAHRGDPPTVAHQQARRALARGRPHGNFGKCRVKPGIDATASLAVPSTPQEVTHVFTTPSARDQTPPIILPTQLRQVAPSADPHPLIRLQARESA